MYSDAPLAAGDGVEKRGLSKQIHHDDKFTSTNPKGYP